MRAVTASFNSSLLPNQIPALLAVVRDAAGWLTERFLDSADDATLAEAATRFHTAVCPILIHPAVTTRRIRLIRHGLNHLVRGADPLPDRLARCVTPGGAYQVPGLGPTFWAAVAKAAHPDELPLWCPATEAGLARLGHPVTGGTAADRATAVSRGYAAVRAVGLEPWQADDLLERLSRMAGRELSAVANPDPAGWAWGVGPDRVKRAIREVRSRVPLKGRLRAATVEQSAALGRFRERVEAGDFPAAWAALHAAFPAGRWEAGLAALDDAFSPALDADDRALVGCEAVMAVQAIFRVHPLELADVLAALPDPPTPADDPDFAGFSSDTFRFLADLDAANTPAFVAANRDRYLFHVREPLAELCRELARRYVKPVLVGQYGWPLGCDARPGRAVTRIRQNDFGRGSPYLPVQWVTFFRPDHGPRRQDAQFFVRVSGSGVAFGFHLGRRPGRPGGSSAGTSRPTPTPCSTPWPPPGSPTGVCSPRPTT